MKLGKKEAVKDPRNLKMATYMPSLPPVPLSCDWSQGITDWGMMRNNDLGDCTIAAAGHLMKQWTTNSGAMFTVTDSDIVAAYAAVTGYSPSNPSSDTGAVEIDVLNYWRQYGIAGHKIGAYVALNPADGAHIKAAIYLFGGAYIGLALPRSAQNQDVWDVPGIVDGAFGNGEPRSWGGHAVEVVAYDQNGLTVVTWGALKRMTWNFWNKYCDEAFAVLSPDFLSKAGTTPGGFDIAALTADLGSVTN